MKVLVTGGTGFLGTALVWRLVDLGYRVSHANLPLAAIGRRIDHGWEVSQVRVLVRPSSDTSGLPPAAELALGNVTALDSLAAAAQSGVECIIHMAALVQAWAKDPNDFDKVEASCYSAQSGWPEVECPGPALFLPPSCALHYSRLSGQINVGGIQNVLQVLRSTPSVKRVVYTSTFFALGPTDGTTADGTKEHRGSGFFTDYERTKYRADQIAVRAAREEGLDVVMVYPGVIYGPGRVSAANLLVKMIVDHFHGRLPGYIGSGERRSCFVHINDVVTGVLSALEQGRPGQRYVLGGENSSIVGVFKVVQEITGRPPPRLHIPIWVAKIIGLVSVLVARLGGPVPIFTNTSVEAFEHDWAYSSTMAEKDFGYSPLPLAQGLRETLEWLKGHNIISY